MEIRQKATCEDDAIFLSFLTHAEHVCKTFSTKCFLSGSNHATKHGERWEAVGEGAAEGREQSCCLGLPGRRGGASSRRPRELQGPCPSHNSLRKHSRQSQTSSHPSWLAKMRSKSPA